MCTFSAERQLRIGINSNQALKIAEVVLNLMAIFNSMLLTKRYIGFILITIGIIPIALNAQSLKTVSVEGEAQTRIENNETREQAKERAEELAKLDAIQKEFGSYVEQNTDIHVEDGKVNYNILAGTKMKADWIRTTHIKFSYPDQPADKTKEKIIWVKCTIEGEAREIASRANIETFALRCPQKECKASDFDNKQSLYLYFKSPVDGYLSVFLDEGEITRRLLPYDQMDNQSAVKVKGDTEYIFFEKPKGTYESVNADELELYTTKPYEYNTLYVVFSEQPFVKPILENSLTTDNNYIIPKNLPSTDFQEWMSNCRAASAAFQDKKLMIRINKK